MDKLTQNFRKDQFLKTDQHDNTFKRSIVINSTSGKTFYLGIDEKEYKQIKKILCG